MPHDSDVQPTSHARHDVLLVAALAAGDLSGTDRDHATALIETCPECMGLHDDLIVIARATAAAPPPIATRPRDFRLTPEQAARLRPLGWRRVLGAFAGPRLAFTRPLGIGLTTIGLAGLLITNVPLGLGGSAASVGSAAVPASRSAANDVAGEAAAPSDDGTTSLGPVAAPAASAPAASSVAGALEASPAPAASAAPAAAGSGAPRSLNDGSTAAAVPQPGATTTRQAAGGGKAQSSGAPDTTFSVNTETAPAPDLRTLFFVAVVLVGLGLLVLRRVGRRVTPA